MEEFEALSDKIRAFAFLKVQTGTQKHAAFMLFLMFFITPREVIVTADLPYIEPGTVKIEAIYENVIADFCADEEKNMFQRFRNNP